MAKHFGTTRASRADRRDGIVIGSLMMVTGLGMIPIAHLPGPVVPSFMTAFAAAISITQLLTAYLLLTQLRLRAIEFAPLAAAYFFGGLIVIPQAMTFPDAGGAIEALAANPQSSTWLWVFWHAGFPIFILAYVAVTRWRKVETLSRAQRNRAARVAGGAIMIGVPLLVVGLVALATAGVHLLPSLYSDGQYLGLKESGIGWPIWAINVAAVVALVAARPGRMSHLDVWLAVAALAATMDVTLTLLADTRFSLGWYAARIGSAVSSSVVLASFLREIAWLYAALASANTRLASLAANDGLTGLANRRAFDEMFVRVIAHGQRMQTEISLIMIDIDRFKLLNDHYGHPVGDQALSAVARAVADTLRRPFDFVARFPRRRGRLTLGREIDQFRR